MCFLGGREPFSAATRRDATGCSMYACNLDVRRPMLGPTHAGPVATAGTDPRIFAVGNDLQHQRPTQRKVQHTVIVFGNVHTKIYIQQECGRQRPTLQKKWIRPQGGGGHVEGSRYVHPRACNHRERYRTTPNGQSATSMPRGRGTVAPRVLQRVRALVAPKPIQ